jgi:trimethylamine--corrinoid protein Co-methyltransferase
VKSPLQFVDDTTQTLIEICKRGLPIVVSSSPQAGTTAPATEHGILAQINAEVLAGITLGQMVNKGTPMLYGTVPVKARLDNLNDSYGSPETSQYNIDCVQLARFYNLPNYSTAGVCDVRTPGTQSSIERLFSDIVVTLSGPQYLHCAFGLLDGNSTFCLLQAVLDDEHFQRIKFFMRPFEMSQADIDEAHKQINEVVATDQKLYISYIRRMMRSGKLSMPYPFEGDGEKDNAMYLAYEKMQELISKPVEHIDPDKTKRIFNEVPGILPRLNVYK